MKLNFSQIRSITTGAVRLTEESGRIQFHRFTPEQEQHYQQYENGAFFDKVLATAGICLRFRTDSSRLYLKMRMSAGSSRTYYAVDVTVDGQLLGSLDNFSQVQLQENYPAQKFPLGEISGQFQLGTGEKSVCVYFPWSAKAELLEMELEDGAAVIPVKPAQKLLCFGDSITQGYDALHPMNRYPAILAQALGAEEYNKGIGGEIFSPALAACPDGFLPDYITVAYGTNDWSVSDEETLADNSRRFYKTLSETYPDGKIFAITPIWRKDLQEYRPFGLFKRVAEVIEEAVAQLPNVTAISGFDFVPQDEALFADLRLHPNDAGFAHYAQNLCQKMEKILDNAENAC